MSDENEPDINSIKGMRQLTAIMVIRV